MFRKLLTAAALCALAFTTAGCGTTAAALSWGATQLSTATPTVVNSSKAANDGFTLLAKGETHYIEIAHPSPATIEQLRVLRTNLKAALDVINADVAAGNSPVYDTFNEALKAWLAYNASKGIST